MASVTTLWVISSASSTQRNSRSSLHDSCPTHTQKHIHIYIYLKNNKKSNVQATPQDMAQMHLKRHIVFQKSDSEIQSRRVWLNLVRVLTSCPGHMNDLQRTSSLAVPAALSQPELDSRCQFHNHWMTESHSGYERAWTASTAPTEHKQRC